MKPLGRVTLSHVKRALQELGGEATWSEILDQITMNRGGDYSYYLDYDNYKKTTNQVIQHHCPGYKKSKGPAHFEKVGNRFRLLSSVLMSERKRSASTLEHPQLTPIAIDSRKLSQPEHVKQVTYRILRDTAKARRVKNINQFKCQACGKEPIKLTNGHLYAEAHHIRPLGRNHDGHDEEWNIICVCPDCHVKLDYGVMRLDKALLKAQSSHIISDESIDYHNTTIWGKV